MVNIFVVGVPNRICKDLWCISRAIRLLQHPQKQRDAYPCHRLTVSSLSWTTLATETVSRRTLILTVLLHVMFVFRCWQFSKLKWDTLFWMELCFLSSCYIILLCLQILEKFNIFFILEHFNFNNFSLCKIPRNFLSNWLLAVLPYIFLNKFPTKPLSNLFLLETLGTTYNIMVSYLPTGVIFT